MAINPILLGKRVKQLRENKKLTQEQFSEILGIGSKHLSKIETGEKTPSLGLVILMANALDISANDILIDFLSCRSLSSGEELHSIMYDCTCEKREMLIRSVKFLKDLLTEFGM